MDIESQRTYYRMTLHKLMTAYPTWTPVQLASAGGRCESCGGWVPPESGRNTAFQHVFEPIAGAQNTPALNC